MNIHLIAAARPNFMKIAPLYHALKRETWCTPKIVHTGQHYDANMSDAFFQDLRLPSPDFNLEVGSGSHAEQTGGVMIAYERVAILDKPDWIVVVGDVNSTVACALVGAKLRIPVVHLEAGLRSGDRTMPEEINRIVTDAIADLLWTPSSDGNEHLVLEGVPLHKIELVGNIMLDSYEMLSTAIRHDESRAKLGLVNAYGVVTLHRPSNVDDPATLKSIVSKLIELAKKLILVFSVHPRTRKRLEEFSLMRGLEKADGVRIIEPLGYIQFMNVVERASFVITDSGGIQEETTYLGIPCLTVRENTERPITITHGTNRLVRPENLLIEALNIIEGGSRDSRRPPLWDGQTASRCVRSLRRQLDRL